MLLKLKSDHQMKQEWLMESNRVWRSWLHVLRPFRPHLVNCFFLHSERKCQLLQDVNLVYTVERSSMVGGKTLTIFSWWISYMLPTAHQVCCWNFNFRTTYHWNSEFHIWRGRLLQMLFICLWISSQYVLITWQLQNKWKWFAPLVLQSLQQASPVQVIL